MSLYLDASVIVPLVVTEASSEVVRAWLADRAEAFVTGRLAVGKAASAISRLRRMGRLTDFEGTTALAELDLWLAEDVAVLDHERTDLAEAAQLVRRPVPKLLMPDAVHLATARRLRCVLAPNDHGLTRCADVIGLPWAAPV